MLLCSAEARHASAWDAVLTAFFIDACADVTQACEQVRAVLRKDGVWINHGPLLYHGPRGGPKLTADEVLLLLERSGFRLEERGFRPCVYGQDESSMCRTEFNCLFFVARKTEVD